MCDLNTDSSLYVFDVNEDLKSDCVEAEVPAGVIFWEGVFSFGKVFLSSRHPQGQSLGK